MSKIKNKSARIIQRKYVISAAKAGFISSNNLALQFCTKYICKALVEPEPCTAQAYSEGFGDYCLVLGTRKGFIRGEEL